MEKKFCEEYCREPRLNESNSKVCCFTCVLKTDCKSKCTDKQCKNYGYSEPQEIK